MKCPACLLLSLLLAAGLTAAAEPKSPADDLQAIAKKFIDRLAADDFATAVKSFDPPLTAALPPDKLAEGWKSLNAQAGPLSKEDRDAAREGCEDPGGLWGCQVRNSRA